MVEPERPRSPLVNALWGAGISSPAQTPAHRRRARNSMAGVAVGSSAVVGVVVAVTDGWLKGLITAVIMAAVVGLSCYWLSRQPQATPSAD